MTIRIYFCQNLVRSPWSLFQCFLSFHSFIHKRKDQKSVGCFFKKRGNLTILILYQILPFFSSCFFYTHTHALCCCWITNVTKSVFLNSCNNSYSLLSQRKKKAKDDEDDNHLHFYNVYSTLIGLSFFHSFVICNSYVFFIYLFYSFLFLFWKVEIKRKKHKNY